MADIDDRIRAMAERLDCFTEEEFRELADATPLTVEAWRKRGTGPAYIRLGKRFLYPRKDLQRFLLNRLHEPTPLDVRTVL